MSRHSSSKVGVGAAVVALVSVVFVGDASAFAPSSQAPVASSSRATTQPLFMERREMIDMITNAAVGA
eukprot:scaffold5602_cov58-Skeletonema_dohrnii-CCMP3373.AAC.3